MAELLKNFMAFGVPLQMISGLLERKAQCFTSTAQAGPLRIAGQIMPL